MAKVLESFEFSDNRSKFDWSRFVDGKVYQLKSGEDFQFSAKVAQNRAHSFATHRKIKLRTSVVDDKTLVIQAIV